MYFIYTLSYDNLVFYVGLTVNPLSRYINHINLGTPATEKFLATRVYNYDYPEYNILKHSKSYSKASHYEEKVIKSFVKNEIKLLNTAFNPANNRIIVPSKKGFLPYYENKKSYLQQPKQMIKNYIEKNVKKATKEVAVIEAKYN